MSTVISQALLSSLKATGKQYDVRETKTPGFLVRVNAQGSMTYMCEYARGRRVKIGRVGVTKLAEAREEAIDIVAKANRGENPRLTRETTLNLGRKGMTVQEFIDEKYQPWAAIELKSWKKTVQRIKGCFAGLANRGLTELTPMMLNEWRIKKIEDGRAPETVNCDIATLKAALSKAVEWKLIDKHPLAKFKLLSVNHDPKIRYLTPVEEKRLRHALDVRENHLKAGRESANQWRTERGYPLFPYYANGLMDYLKPMVVLSINTGMRQGEVFSLEWENIDFEHAIVSVVGGKAKSRKTRHIPLNQEAADILKIWEQQKDPGNTLVFPSRTGEKLENVRKAWFGVLEDAGIENFRWHDMRHHFASRLVMLGVDLNTVRELLGHSDIKMTLRYAHLAPEHKANAVAKLVR